MDANQSKGKGKAHSSDSTSMHGDLPEHQNPHAFWKIKDKKGWKHGIMVNGNRQHWKCIYCSVTGRSGGVSGLKRHLVGAKNTKKCVAVPEEACAEVKKLMDDTKEERQKRAALKGLKRKPASATSSVLRESATSHRLISGVPKDCSSVLRESAQGSMVLAHVPGGTCYCYFCSLERAMERPEYEEMLLRLSHRKMAQVADMMLSAAEELSVGEQSLTMTK